MENDCRELRFARAPVQSHVFIAAMKKICPVRVKKFHMPTKRAYSFFLTANRSRSRVWIESLAYNW